jgi:hypothetical protein
MSIPERLKNRLLQHLLTTTLVCFGFLCLGSSLVLANQVAVQELSSSEQVDPEFAQSLMPDLLAALSTIPNLAVLSENDIRAFLEKDGSLQPKDCKPEHCFFEVSNNLESELLLTGTLGRLGRKWVASLTLTSLEANKVVRKSIGTRTGDNSAAKDAILNAVRNLFREELPKNLQGPSSLSRLGFKAATLGLAKRVRAPNHFLKSHRKRIILDLVATELEFDVAPKIDILDNISRNEIAALKLESFMAPTREDYLHYLRAQQSWRALREDLNRVREIRARARTLGIKPTARPLRFETPAPLEWPAQSEFDAYISAATPAMQVIETLLQGWQSGDEMLMTSVYSAAHPTALSYRIGLRGDKSNPSVKDFQPIAFHNLSPRMIEAALEAHARGELLIYVAELEKKVVKAASRVFLIQDKGTWKIRHW